mgnify:CR=1 FL=1
MEIFIYLILLSDSVFVQIIAYIGYVMYCR